MTNAYVPGTLSKIASEVFVASTVAAIVGLFVVLLILPRKSSSQTGRKNLMLHRGRIYAAFGFGLSHITAFPRIILDMHDAIATYLATVPVFTIIGLLLGVAIQAVIDAIKRGKEALPEAIQAAKNKINKRPVEIEELMARTLDSAKKLQETAKQKFQTLSNALGNDKNRIPEQFFAQAWTELEDGSRNPGLWAKAYAEEDGRENRAKALYIKYRAKELWEVSLSEDNKKHQSQNSRFDGRHPSAIGSGPTSESAHSGSVDKVEPPRPEQNTSDLPDLHELMYECRVELSDCDRNAIRSLFASDEAIKLWTAIKRGQFHSISYLIKQNPSLLHIYDAQGNSPLHYAIANGNAGAATILLVMGAKPSLLNSHGNSAKDLGLSSENPDIAALFTA